MSLSALTSAPEISGKLSRLFNGEYSAASVVGDPIDATRQWLVRQQDGNYGTGRVAPALNGLPSARSSAGVLSAVSSLTLGGY